MPPHVRLVPDGGGYTLKELMAYMGHADLQMVNRYVKLLPQPGEDDAAARLNDSYGARRPIAATPNPTLPSARALVAALRD